MTDEIIMYSKERILKLETLLESLVAFMTFLGKHPGDVWAETMLEFCSRLLEDFKDEPE